MEIYYFDGLLCTSIKVTFNGNTTIIDNVVIDTGAVESILSSNIVKDIGIKIAVSDKTAVTRSAGGSKMRFFYKTIDEIEIGNIVFKDIKLDFGNIDPSGEINGLIGLDLLRLLHAVMDIDIPFIYLKQD